eukprot:COSAG03_NODE_2172_length_3049_cov_9.823390_3_plen_85_part_00
MCLVPSWARGGRRRRPGRRASSWRDRRRTAPWRRRGGGAAAAQTVGQTCVSSVHAAGASETSDFVRGDSSLLCRPEIVAGAARD